MKGSDIARGPGRVLVFDSGVGGLTVAQEIRAARPTLSLDYAADTGFFPYGDKSDDALRARLPDIARRLFEVARPDVFVIACNTASTLALEEVRAVLPVPVVGTVPAIKPAAKLSQTGVIGLLATPGTIRRAYTAALIRQFAASLHVAQLGSIELVTLAEAVASGEAVPDAPFGAAQAPLFAGERGAEVDVVVLACTHFPLVRDRLERTAPRPLTYIDSGAAIARQTLRLLDAAPDLSSDARPPRAYITSDPDAQAQLIRTLGRFGFAEVSALL